jgi:ParB family chromosome partitioning protein
MSNEKKSRLGRGLDALLGSEEPVVAASASVSGRAEVSVAAIEKNPYQPRKTFDDDDLSSLSESIRNHGVLQPLVVRQVGERYQLIAGERRLRAAMAAGLDAVPVTVVDFNDQQSFEAALVENIQRSDLNPIDKAQGFREYLEHYHMTHEQLAGRLGLSRPTITNLVALLELPAEVQEAVRRGELTEGHAKVIKGIPDPLRQVAVAKEIIARGLSVHATTAYVKQVLAEEKAGTAGGDTESGGRSAPEKTAHVQGVEDELRQKLGLKVEIRVKAKERGQVILTFESNDDFERVLEALRR